MGGNGAALGGAGAALAAAAAAAALGWTLSVIGGGEGGNFGNDFFCFLIYFSEMRKWEFKERGF